MNLAISKIDWVNSGRVRRQPNGYREDPANLETLDEQKIRVVESAVSDCLNQREHYQLAEISRWLVYEGLDFATAKVCEHVLNHMVKTGLLVSIASRR